MDMLVSCDWLAGELAAGDLKILDATAFLPGTPRDARAEYLDAHIPGALYLDLPALCDRDDPRPAMVPTNAQFEAHMAGLGISDSDRIIVYDNSPLLSSGRAWWLLRTFGAHKTAILDGGIGAWRTASHAIEAGEGTPGTGRFSAQRSDDQIRGKTDLLANLTSGGAQVVDARGAARFEGTAAEPRPGMAEGHIPQSRNVPTTEMIGTNGLWKRGADMAAAFAAGGVDMDKPLIMSCGSGVTACNLLFGAALIGKADVTIYDGSWSEWGADPATPKASGAA